jgi:2-iminobutanoate/2-iminopropanoate deaminase
MSGGGSSEAVQPAGAPAPIGPYAPARKGALSGRWVVTSGQIGLDPGTGKLVPGGIGPETEQTLRNLRAILDAAGSGLASVVKTTVYLADMADFAAMNERYASAFGDHKPARTTVAVAGLPLGGRVEIEAWAFER